MIIGFNNLVFKFIPYAEGTADLRNNILAFGLNSVHKFIHIGIVEYLTAIRKLVSRSGT